LSPKYKPHVRCWDANSILGWLAGEPDKVPELRPVILAAEKPDSNIVILTSALALVEVLWLKPHPKLTPEKEQKIRDFFKHSWVSVIDVEPKNCRVCSPVSVESQYSTKRCDLRRHGSAAESRLSRHFRRTSDCMLW